MTSEIKVNTIKDLGGNTVLTSNGSGTFTSNLPSTTLSGSTNNTITTVTGANAIQGEAKLTFDGSVLNNVQSAGAASEIKASAASVYTKVIADDASGFSAIDYSHDLRFKDAGTEKMRIHSDGNIGIGTTSPDAKVHIMKADAGALIDSDADDLLIENNGNTGLTIGSSTSGDGNIRFSDSGDADVGEIKYNHSDNAMTFKTNGTQAMKIDGAGIITHPKQPCFFAHANSQSGVGSGTTDIPFGNERFDLNADFSTPNFTAPVTGKYAFQMSVRIVNCQAGGNVSVLFQPSNAEIRAWRQDSDGKAMVYETASASLVIDMDANDTCKLQINSSVDNDFIIDGSSFATYFSGYLVA